MPRRDLVIIHVALGGVELSFLSFLAEMSLWLRSGVWKSTYDSLGQVDFGQQRLAVELAELNRGARVHEADKNFKRQEGDHSLGIVGKESFPKSDMSQLGSHQNFTAKATFLWSKKLFLLSHFVISTIRSSELSASCCAC